MTSQITSCACCGYEAVPTPCDAKKVWELNNDTLLIYHSGKHSCVAKKPSANVSKEAAEFFSPEYICQAITVPLRTTKGDA